MSENKVEVNPFDYGYTQDQVVMMPANDLLNIIAYATRVKSMQPSVGVLYEYPETVENVYSKDGELEESKVEWRPYESGAPFFKSANNPVKFATDIALMSEQIIFSLGAIHEQNINAGTAKKLEDLTTTQELDNILK
jgi:hypothetical protein